MYGQHLQGNTVPFLENGCKIRPKLLFKTVVTIWFSIKHFAKFPHHFTGEL